MIKVEITFEGLKNLYYSALRGGSLAAWAEVALQWAEHADKEINRLSELVEDEYGGKVDD